MNEDIPNNEGLKVLIEEASVNDLSGIDAVRRASWLSTYPNEEHGISREDIEHRMNHLDTDAVRRKRWHSFEHKADNFHVLVARVEGNVAGFCMVRAGETVNELVALNVAPVYQNMHVGTSLWEKARTFIDADKDTLVHVVEYNEPAIHFYKKLGFRSTGTEVHDKYFTLKSGVTLPQIELVLSTTKEK